MLVVGVSWLMGEEFIFFMVSAEIPLPLSSISALMPLPPIRYGYLYFPAVLGVSEAMDEGVLY